MFASRGGFGAGRVLEEDSGLWVWLWVSGFGLPARGLELEVASPVWRFQRGFRSCAPGREVPPPHRRDHARVPLHGPHGLGRPEREREGADTGMPRVRHLPSVSDAARLSQKGLGG